MTKEFKPRVLLVEDDPNLGNLLLEYLQAKEYDTTLATNGKEGLTQFKNNVFDVCIFDVMMPVMDGMEACRQLKEIPETKNIPVIFLTARSEEFAELAGFEAGADDYIAKPVRNRVLLSRVKAILRRRNALVTPEPEKYEFENLKIDRERFVVEYDGRTLQLPRKEFELLSFLASRPGRVFSRDEILENVWGNEVLVVDRTIDVHVRKIREKLDDKFIYTVKGVGYKFES